MNIRIAACVATLAVTAGAHAATADKNTTVTPVLTGPEGSIPFANTGGIYDFHVENDDGLWVQARGGQWYYGKFFTPCIGIQFAITLGFMPGRGNGTFDRWSSVVTHGSGKCTLTSLRPSEAPPGVTPKRAKPDGAAKPDSAAKPDTP